MKTLRRICQSRARVAIAFAAMIMAIGLAVENTPILPSNGVVVAAQQSPGAARPIVGPKVTPKLSGPARDLPAAEPPSGEEVNPLQSDAAARPVAEGLQQGTRSARPVIRRRRVRPQPAERSDRERPRAGWLQPERHEWRRRPQRLRPDDQFHVPDLRQAGQPARPGRRDQHAVDERQPGRYERMRHSEQGRPHRPVRQRGGSLASQPVRADAVSSASPSRRQPIRPEPITCTSSTPVVFPTTSRSGPGRMATT